MYNKFRKFFLFLLFAAAFAVSDCAAAKIAVVDLEKIFREFYKSRIAEDAIKQQAAAYRKYVEKLSVELNRLKQEMQTAREMRSTSLFLRQKSRKLNSLLMKKSKLSAPKKRK